MHRCGDKTSDEQKSLSEEVGDEDHLLSSIRKLGLTYLPLSILWSPQEILR